MCSFVDREKAVDQLDRDLNITQWPWPENVAQGVNHVKGLLNGHWKETDG